VRIYDRDAAIEVANNAELESAIFTGALHGDGLVGVGIAHLSGSASMTDMESIGDASSLNTYYVGLTVIKRPVK
jgi:hypothetical protein